MEKLSDQNSEHRSSCYKYKIRTDELLYIFVFHFCGTTKHDKQLQSHGVTSCHSSAQPRCHIYLQKQHKKTSFTQPLLLHLHGITHKDSTETSRLKTKKKKISVDGTGEHKQSSSLLNLLLAAIRTPEVVDTQSNFSLERCQRLRKITSLTFLYTNTFQ